jgi:DNA-directed RNA polymerase specialized sigma24 family protein
MSVSEAKPERRFPTTHWSLIGRLKSHDKKETANAVAEIFTTYRYPLYGYLRTTGMHHEDSEDVLQGFFAKMLRNDAFMQADSERGKLRTFLLTALSRFRLNWQRGEQRRQQRVRAEGDLWDADESRFQMEQHAMGETPADYYDRRWAMELIARVMTSLRTAYVRRNKQSLHEALVPLLSSTLPETDGFAVIASRLGVTENALRVSLCRLRGDFRDLLLKEVKLTLDEGEDVKAEIQHLLSLFQG